MKDRVVLFTAAAALVLAVCARAGEPPVRQDDDPYERRMKFLRGARKGVVLLRTEIGVASGTVLDREAGLVACAKKSLDSAGRVEAYLFTTEVPERGPDVVKRVALGEAEVVALHRSADAAVLRVALPADMVAFGFQPGAVNQGAPVSVVGVQGAAPFDDAGDLDVRRGAVGAQGRWEPNRVPLTAPTHRNSAGGAVLLSNGALFGVASFDLPDGFPGAVVPYRCFLKLRDEPESCALAEGEAAEYVRRKDGPPPFWPVSPGGPAGKRVSFGRGVTAVKEARGVLATGVFVLDTDEALEYFATPLERGKLHETVIAVDADPAVLYLALTGLKYKSGGWIQRGDGAVPYGTRLRVYVEWDAAEARAIREWLSAIDPPWERPGHREVREKAREGLIRWEPGRMVRVRAEELMFNVREGHPMVRTDWVYTGSGFFKDDQTGRHLFRATLDGVLVAVYNDPSAVFNIPLKTGADDTYYCTRGSFNPPRGTSCTVIFLPADAPSGGAPSP